MQDAARALERHIQTLVLALLTALIFWMGNTVYETSISIAEIKGDVRVVTGKLETMELSFVDRYSRREAEREFSVMDAILLELKARVRTLEVRVLAD